MRLIFFTNSYPFGHGELWKTNELTVLKSFFEEIIVQPFSYAGNKTPVAFIEGVTYNQPLFEEGVQLPLGRKKAQSVLFSSHAITFFREFFAESVFVSRSKTMQWLNASAKALVIAENEKLKQLFATVDSNTILYFYWGREASEVLPLKCPACFKVVTRFHRYDLYREVSNNYMPYQRRQIEAMDFALPCSENGRQKLSAYYPLLADKIIVKRLGTISEGRSPVNTGERLHIVSCSFVEKVKRVDIIARSLKHVKVPVKWTHIGTGSLFNEVKKIAGTVGHHIELDFAGKLSNKEVIAYYSKNSVDLFINVSESEGVPVSVMEAFAAGIPVMATEVGGTGEIVHDAVGTLLPKDVKPEFLARAIDIFAGSSIEEKNKKREAAFRQYEEMCNAEKLANEFAEFLLDKNVKNVLHN